MTALEAQWNPVRHLILGDDPQLRIFEEVSVWYRKIDVFRKGEDLRMFVQQPTQEDLAVHKSLLQRLIADGEHLVSLIQMFGLPENAQEMTPQSVGATVKALRADYRGWQEPMAPEKREQLLKKLASPRGVGSLLTCR